MIDYICNAYVDDIVALVLMELDIDMMVKSVRESDEVSSNG